MIVCSKLRSIQENFKSYVSKTAAVFWLSVAAISFLGIITKPRKVPLKDFPCGLVHRTEATQDSFDNIVLENPVSPFPLWALKIMEDGHTSETTNLLGKRALRTR